MNRELQVRLYANDRMLKALIALMVERDPRLLQDLRDVFQQADDAGHAIGDNHRDTWSEINRELELISEMTGLRSKAEQAHGTEADPLGSSDN